jgi:hypothetical protein
MDMAKISWILERLDDGCWHSIVALGKSIDFSEFEINELISFLSRFNLATIDETGSKVKVNPDFRKLVVQTN